MVLRRFNTRYPAGQLRDEMARLLSGFFTNTADGSLVGRRRGQPAVNVWEEDDQLLVELEVPGVRSDQVEISVAGGELSLTVERPDLRHEDVTYHRRERPVGAFTRVLRLPTDVNADKVEAELRNGVLTVRLPKADSVKPRKIAVATA